MSKDQSDREGLHPSYGHPLVLYSNDSDNPTFFLAENDLAAKKKNPDQNDVYAIDVTDLIKLIGHTQTNIFLKRFGPSWICKTGRIYFKDFKQLEKSIEKSVKGNNT